MYANESKGETWPPQQAKLVLPPNGNAPATLRWDMGPYTIAIYPDYLTDPSILMCPSDGDSNVGDIFAADGTSLLLDARSPAQGGGRTANGRGCNHGGSCMGAVDVSYGYFGYLLDLVGPQDPTKTAVDLATALAPFGVAIANPANVIVNGRGPRP